MKVVTAQAMSEIEARAYQQGFTEQEFMEKAGQGIARSVQDYIQIHHLQHRILLLCGKGNNGGDAFVAGRYLMEQGYEVEAIQPEPLAQSSPLCRINGAIFIERGGKVHAEISSFGASGIILDGFFGTGFKGQVRAPYAALIDAANQSKLPILAIDIPSGLNGSTGESGSSVIQAAATIYLGLPKTGFFLQQGWNAVGKLQGVDFGLPKSLIESAPADFDLITNAWAASLLPPIHRNRHKYQSGYVIGLAGSPTMPGAGLLASLSALRGGSGMVRLLHPSGMEEELAASPYELIKIPYNQNDTERVLETMQKAGAGFIGPGLGRSEETKKLLKAVLGKLEKPCVVDADALILYAEGECTLPPQSILTPHTGEMQALLNSPKRLILTLELLHTCQNYAEEHGTTLILKGAPTFVFHPGAPIAVNPTGDPGMATAGSGDVLTGLLAALLSQGLDCHQAAILGVYLHGLAGELAAEERGTSYGMIASDLIAHFGEAFRKIKEP